MTFSMYRQRGGTKTRLEMSIKRSSLDKLAKRQSVNSCLLIENDDGAWTAHGMEFAIGKRKNSIVGHCWSHAANCV
jgi:hypothetical protein